MKIATVGTALSLDDEQCLYSLLRRTMWAYRGLDVVVWGNKWSLFPCFTMIELGDDECEKMGALSHIRPTCNLIDR